MGASPQREAELRYYLLRLFRCTGFADSIYSVDDLRLKRRLNIISFTYSDAPTSLTASAQSMTLG